VSFDRLARSSDTWSEGALLAADTVEFDVSASRDSTSSSLADEKREEGDVNRLFS
jgi:hypothetical protein